MVAPMRFPTGQGTQVFVRDLAVALCQAGQRVTLLSYGGAQSWGPPHGLTWLPIARVPVGTHSGPTAMRAVAMVNLARHTRALLSTGNFTHLHLHNLEGACIGSLLHATGQTGVPVIHHVHNRMEDELPTYLRWGRPARPTRLLGRILDRRLPQGADALVAMTHADRAALRTARPTEDVRLIPADIDAGGLRPDAEAVRHWRARLPARDMVLYTGNDDGIQNLVLLKSAWQRLVAHRPDVSLMLATHSEGAQFSDFASLRNVHRLVLRDHRDLAAVLSLGRAAVCPRQVRGGFPIKVLNARAAGLPTVVTPVVGAAMADGPKVGGVVCAEPSAKGFADAIEKALAEPKEAPSYAAFSSSPYLELYGQLHAQARAA